MTLVLGEWLFIVNKLACPYTLHRFSAGAR
jgi:hypothetical protein